MSAYPHAERLSIQRGGNTYSCEYSATHDLATGNDELRHAIVAIHGSGSPGWDYFEIALHLARVQGRLHDTLVVAPQFTRHSTNPANSDIDPQDVASFDNDALMWSGGAFHGYDANWPQDSAGNGPPVSSFDVVDSILERLATNLSRLETVVLFGQSGGGQFVQRYAFCSPVEDEVLRPRDIEIHYVAANPGNHLFLNANRPRPVPPTCIGFDSYGFGLNGIFPPYLQRRSVTVGVQRSRYESRNVVYMIGANDNNPTHASLPTGCESMTQGLHRYQRSSACYLSAVEEYGDSVMRRHAHAVIPAVGHGARVFFRPEAQHFLFRHRGHEPKLSRSGDSSRVDAGGANALCLVAIRSPSVHASFFRNSRDRSHYTSTDQLVSAQIDDDGDLRLHSWRRRRDGTFLSPTTRAAGGQAGAVKSIDLARSNVDWRDHRRTDGAVIVSSCISGGDRLKLIAWRMTEAGQFRRIGDVQSAQTQVSAQRLTALRVIDQVVTSRDTGMFASVTRNAGGTIETVLWQLDNTNGVFASPATLTIHNSGDDGLAIACIDEERYVVVCGVAGTIRLLLLETDAISAGGSALAVRVSVDTGLPSAVLRLAIDQYGNAHIVTLGSDDRIVWTSYAIDGFGVTLAGQWTTLTGKLGSDRGFDLVSLRHRGLMLGAKTSSGRLKLMTFAVAPDATRIRRIADSGNAIGVSQSFGLLTGDLPFSGALVCGVADSSPARKLRLIGFDYNR